MGYARGSVQDTLVPSTNPTSHPPLLVGGGAPTSTGGQWVCTFNGYEDLGPRTEPGQGRMEKLTFRAGFSFVHFRTVLDLETAGKLQSIQRKNLMFSTF